MRPTSIFFLQIKKYFFLTSVRYVHKIKLVEGEELQNYSADLKNL